MNKKERSCDVLALQATKGRADNIVEWRHIITALLALVSLTASAAVPDNKSHHRHTRQWVCARTRFFLQG